MAKTQLKLLKLGGSPYDIGYIHGKEEEEGIKDFINKIVEHARESKPDFTKEEALSYAELYVPFIETYTPHLAKEIKGISDGAKISLEEAYLLQLRAEFTQRTIEEECCTSFAIPKNITESGEVLVGQNVDLRPFYKDFGIMLHITSERKPVILCYSQIGSVAHAGINSAGIGWATNALYSLGWKPGVPRSILYRLIMEKENVSEALKIIKDAKRASSGNYLISHESGEIKDIETTVENYGIISCRGDVMAHANHFVHPKMIRFEKRPKEKLANSRFRENRFREMVIKYQEKLTIQKLKQFLTDHERYPRAICTHDEGNPWNVMTVASIIAQPEQGLMHVSIGQGCKNEYARYSL